MTGKQQTNSEKAMATYSMDFNCCQAVLSTYAPIFDLDQEISFKLGAGFTAGMSYQGKTCGAVVGAYLVIGLLTGNVKPDDREKITMTNRLISDFNTSFTKLNGSTECKELLQKDVSQSDELKDVLDNHLFDVHCPKYVGAACRILDPFVEKYMKAGY